MSDDLGLDAAEQDERDLQIAVAGAQRLLHDEILQQFLSEMRKTAEKYAVYGTAVWLRDEDNKPLELIATAQEIRELNRVKVLAIDELRGYLQTMARVNQDRLENDARAAALE